MRGFKVDGLITLLGRALPFSLRIRARGMDRTKSEAWSLHFRLALKKRKRMRMGIGHYTYVLIVTSTGSILYLFTISWLSIVASNAFRAEMLSASRQFVGMLGSALPSKRTNLDSLFSPAGRSGVNRLFTVPFLEGALCFTRNWVVWKCSWTHCDPVQC